MVGIAITAIGAVATLLFSLQPNLKPCFGGSSAEFTGAPVFPRVHFRDHLVREGTPRQEAAQETDVIGAEVRFSYRTNGLRGAQLPVTWSLVTLARDGTLAAVVPGQDRAQAMIVTPDACSEAGGKDLFVPIPDPNSRYRVVLELYRDAHLEERIALLETPPFRG